MAFCWIRDRLNGERAAPKPGSVICAFLLALDRSFELKRVATRLPSVMNVRIPHMSGWLRGTLAPGSIVLLDEQRWLPAVRQCIPRCPPNMVERSISWHALVGGSHVPISGGGRKQHT